MDTQKTILILRTLANGIDPVTGEVFPVDSPYQNTEIVRALFNAADLLKDIPLQEDTKNHEAALLLNKGKAWTDEEDKELTEGFFEGMNGIELSEKHQRTKGAIRSRLVRLRLIDRFGKKIAFRPKGAISN